MDLVGRYLSGQANHEEAKRLEEELRRTQLEMEEKQRALHEALTTPQQLHVQEHDEDDEESHSNGLYDTVVTLK